MFNVALLGPDAIGTRLARELVHRLPVPALLLRDGPCPDSANRLPPAGWLLRLLPCATSRCPAVLGPLRRLASWWYRRAGFIVILHGRAEIEGFRSRSWPSGSTAAPARGASRGDLVVILDDPTPRFRGPARLRSLRFGRVRRREPAPVDATVVVVDASRPIGQVVDEVERPIRSRASRHLVPVEAPALESEPATVHRRGAR